VTLWLPAVVLAVVHLCRMGMTRIFSQPVRCFWGHVDSRGCCILRRSHDPFATPPSNADVRREYLAKRAPRPRKAEIKGVTLGLPALVLAEQTGRTIVSAFAHFL
jgi:hypothetical protein